MKGESIASLAYRIKRSKERGKGAIVFLGAGASKSGGIPLAGEIREHILERYSDNPKIAALSDEDKLKYAKVMDCLIPDERKELFAEYVKRANINVTHIYLAHLMREEQQFIDYVLTTNFDNLMLRALALYNIFPPVHDLAVLKELNTTNIDKGSVVYLHGRHNSILQLNTEEEMGTIRGICRTLFHSIKDRPWIFIGYSGNDPIFDIICALGRFDQNLYWVTPDCDKLETRVSNFLDMENKNTYLINPYDADSFMIKLYNQLDIEEQPIIFDKPFSTIQKILDGIVDIDDKEDFKAVKIRFEISKKQVKEAVSRYEENKGNTKKIGKENLHKEIADLIASENYDEKIIAKLEERALMEKDDKTKKLLADLYFGWAFNLCNYIENGQKEEDFTRCIEIYQKAIELNPENNLYYFNYGYTLLAYAKKNGWNNKLKREAYDILHKGIELGSDVYNLACYYSLIGEKDKALEWLEKSLEREEDTTDFILADTDWISFKDNSDFINLIKKYKKQDNNNENTKPYQEFLINFRSDL